MSLDKGLAIPPVLQYTLRRGGPSILPSYNKLTHFSTASERCVAGQILDYVLVPM